MKNRDVLLKTDLCDLLCVIDSRLCHDYICIIDLLEGIDPEDIGKLHKCKCSLIEANPREKCRECISNWLNSESKNNHFV